MRTKHIVLAVAILLAAFILPGAVVKTQPNLPIINVDTLVNLGKNEIAEAGGALFLPDGNVIALWKDTPYIIDSKSGEILRKLESCNSETVNSAKLSPDGTKFVATKMGPIFVIWDVPTGKIIKTLQNINDYSFAPDGSKLYVCGGNSSKLGAIRVLDINTFEEIERFGSFVSGWEMDISPDGQTLAVSVYKNPNDEYDKKTNQVILIDLKDKTKYTVLETLEPQVYSMEFSPDGKQITFAYGGISPNIYIYIYNRETKEKKYIKLSDITNLLGVNSSFGKPQFFNSKELIFTSLMPGNPYDIDITVTWDIEQNILKKIIKFYSPTSDLQNKKLLLCSWNGAIAILDSEYVSVKDDIIKNESYLQFSNNQLEYYSDIAFFGESKIYDTVGKLMLDLGSQPFVIGKNIIKVNQYLPIGIYILTIKTGTEQITKKFIVE